MNRTEFEKLWEALEANYLSTNTFFQLLFVFFVMLLFIYAIIADSLTWIRVNCPEGFWAKLRQRLLFWRYSSYLAIERQADSDSAYEAENPQINVTVA